LVNIIIIIIIIIEKMYVCIGWTTLDGFTNGRAGPSGGKDIRTERLG
jgi:hypothetical protein